MLCLGITSFFSLSLFVCVGAFSPFFSFAAASDFALLHEVDKRHIADIEERAEDRVDDSVLAREGDLQEHKTAQSIHRNVSKYNRLGHVDLLAEHDDDGEDYRRNEQPRPCRLPYRQFEVQLLRTRNLRKDVLASVAQGQECEANHVFR